MQTYGNVDKGPEHDADKPRKETWEQRQQHGDTNYGNRADGLPVWRNGHDVR